MTLMEKYGLAAELIGSLTEGARGELSARQLAELNRRLDAYEADPANTVAWEEIEARHIEQYGS
jgi:putative addiction module component (TIGR02574 family)